MDLYKSRYTKEYRINEFNKITKKYPERIPIIVCKDKKCLLNDIDKQKYLVPKDLTISQFVYIIRKRINIESHEALFVTINNTLQSSNSLIEEIYNKYKDDDGFLYVTYTSENTFG